MMDPSVLQEQGARKMKIGKIYKRHHLGITPMIGLWLRGAGWSRINPSSESARRLFKGYAAIPPDPYAVRLLRNHLVVIVGAGAGMMRGGAPCGRPSRHHLRWLHRNPLRAPWGFLMQKRDVHSNSLIPLHFLPFSDTI